MKCIASSNATNEHLSEILGFILRQPFIDAFTQVHLLIKS